MSYNSSERNQVRGIIVSLRDALRADGVKAAEHWRKRLGSYIGSGDPLRNNVTE